VKGFKWLQKELLEARGGVRDKPMRKEMGDE
jgi:hypothetical protein